MEAILNSRSIISMLSDSADLLSLTLGYFLIRSPLTLYPEPSLEKFLVSRTGSASNKFGNIFGEDGPENTYIIANSKINGQSNPI